LIATIEWGKGSEGGKRHGVVAEKNVGAHFTCANQMKLRNDAAA
jgi:hypothetical protein